MPRFTVKTNRVMMGWEDAFRLLDGSVEAVATISDVEFVLHMESIAVGDIKPQMDRLPKYYVNNSTRKNSYTYDSDFKVGSSSLSGDLKHGHLFDAVMGGTSVTDQTTYDEVRITGGDRSSLFIHFNHGTKRAKQMIGVTVNELTIDTKEGEMVTFDAPILSAKLLDSPPITGDVSAMIDVSTPPFHWKHVKICISLDNMASSYNSQTRNYVESAKVTIKNETEYKNGAQCEETSENPNYYIEKKFDVEVEVTIYPDDRVLWLFAPSESEYNDYGTKGTVHYENLAVSTFEDGETITGATSGETGIVVADWDSNKLFIRNKSGAFESGESITGGTSGATADIIVAYQEFGMSIVGGDPSGLSGSTTYEFMVNDKHYSITTIAALTYADIITLIDTALDGDDMACALNGGDIRITSDVLGTTPPDRVSILSGAGNDLLTALTGFTIVDDPVGGFINGHISFKLTLERDTNDFIEIYSRNLQLDPISEVLENIENGVDPITFTGKLARSISDIDVWIKTPLHDNSYSVKY